MRSKQDRKAAEERYARAERALHENYLAEVAAGIDYETDAFLAVNDECWDARHEVSWWRRWPIGRRVMRETDFWNRLREAERAGGFA